MRARALAHPALLLASVALVALLFAEVEIQIEGGAGWGATLPTWRIEHHWLLDVFWGGRAMTGYHAWVFPFMAAMFHLPFAVLGRWSPRLEARVLGALMWFWIIEDALWFILNPAFGWAGLNPQQATWHPRWFLGLPIDYWQFSLVGGALIWWSFRPVKPRLATTQLDLPP